MDKRDWKYIKRLKYLANTGQYLTDEQQEYLKDFKHIDYPKERRLGLYKRLSTVKPTKPKPIVKRLTEVYGGKWIYVPFEGIWESSNGYVVRRVANCICDDICNCGSSLYIYFHDGRPSERVNI